MSMKHKLALAFPGQGAQTAGMGLDVIKRHPHLKILIELAELQTGAPLQDIIQSGDARLSETIYTQPAMLLAELLLYEHFINEFHLKPEALCGFSLGEYAALYAGGVFGAKEAFRLIDIRAKAMHTAAVSNPGSMAAILGLDIPKTIAACVQSSTNGEIVVPANFNSPGQIVISGHTEALKRAMTACLAAGARRAMPLAVSGAFHSPLMNSARIAFEQALETSSLSKPHTPIIMNTTAKPLCFDEIKLRMAEQIEKPVLFEQTVAALKEAGITCVIEIGPGTVLAGLIRKCAPDIDVFSYQKTADFESLKGWLQNHELI